MRGIPAHYSGRFFAVMVEQGTFGDYIRGLRGKERLSDVARRINQRITSQYLGTMEEKRTPGDIRPTTLMLLAEAYEEHYPSREAAFWDLWKRAGYPLPPGFAELTEEGRRVLALYYSLPEFLRGEAERIIQDFVQQHGADAPTDQ